MHIWALMSHTPKHAERVSETHEELAAWDKSALEFAANTLGNFKKYQCKWK